MSSLFKTKPTPAPENDTNGTNGRSDPAPPAYDAFSSEGGLGGPPAEEVDQVNLTEAFDKLSLGTDPKYPDVDTCLAHLKLLFAIQVMKEEVGYSDGLWNIWDTRTGTEDNAPESDLEKLEKPPNHAPALDEASNKKLAVLSKIREKRWAVFLARAVDRYEAWWISMQTPNGNLTEADMHTPDSEKYDLFVSSSNNRIAWDSSNLPPLGECHALC